MKILYAIDSLKIGGAEMLLLNMLKRYQPKHQIEVVYFTEGPLHEDVTAMGIPVHRISKRGLKDPFAFLRLLGIIRRFKPDVIHTHLTKSDVSGQLMGFLGGVPVRVLSLHNNDSWRTKPFFSNLMRLIVSPAQKYIAVSEAVRDFTVENSHYPEDKMMVIENGIDLDRFDPAKITPFDRAQWGVDADAPLVAVIGRLQPQKAHTVFLEAAAAVKREMPQARFVIVGDGDLREDLLAKRDELGLQREVIFAGIIRDIPAVLAAVDVLTFSSDWEGLPVALLEGMAMQKPVVSTAVGGVPLVVQDGVNGLLVAPRQPQKLATELLRVLREPELATRLGQAARQTIADKYSAAVMHDRILELYRSLREKPAVR
jgi:glycosyltransferase involved in cell wall biosynthesis